MCGCYTSVFFTEYRRQTQAQFQVLVEQVKTRYEKLEVRTIGIQPMLDCVSFEPPEGAWVPRDGPYQSIVDCCQTVWVDFKEFARSAAHGAMVHTLM